MKLTVGEAIQGIKDATITRPKEVSTKPDVIDKPKQKIADNPTTSPPLDTLRQVPQKLPVPENPKSSRPVEGTIRPSNRADKLPENVQIGISKFTKEPQTVVKPA